MEKNLFARLRMKKLSPDICLNYLDGNCSNSNCNEIHHDKPYVWQYAKDESGAWLSFSNDICTTLEKQYNNLKDFHEFKSKSKIYFDTHMWTCDTRGFDRPIRRCSTPSSKVSNHQFSTKYQWYFIDEKQQYIEYGKTNVNIQKRSATATTSDDLEEAFCRGDKHLETSSNKHAYRIDFLNMRQTNTSTNVTRKIIRRPLPYNFDSMRMQPKITVKTPAVTVKNHAALKHEWFFKNEFGKWIKYGCSTQLAGKNIVSSHTSDDIEKSFLNNRNQSIYINCGKHSYVLDFQKRIQTNTATKMQREIKREPIPNLVGSPNRRPQVNRPRQEKLLNGNVLPGNFPKYWSPMNDKEICVRVPLLSHENKYQEIVNLVKKTLNVVSIVKLERIQNSYLWNAFLNKQRYMKAKSPNLEIKECYLFHGTDSKHIESICIENLDWRRHGSNVGEAYGRGSYFSNDASFSNRYTKGSPRCLFIARVLIGNTEVGNSSVKVTAPNCDTTVDSKSNPKIFVKYHDDQYYPEYLMLYNM